VDQTINSIILAASVVASQQAAWWVEKRLAPAPSWLPSVVSLVIVGCGFYALRFVFESLFNNLRWLRHLLLGRQFIEGDWFIRFKVEGNPVAIGVTHIESTGEGVRFSGEDFQCKGEGQEQGEGQGHYLTDLAILDWPRIKYKYSYHQTAEEHSSQGYGEAQFFEENRRTDKYSGIFFELLGKRVTYYEGWRVSKKEHVDGLKRPETWRKTVQDFFDNLDSGKGQVHASTTK
jgi:hypothetical protein